MRNGIETLDDLIREYPAMKTKLVTPRLLRQAESWCATCCRPSCQKTVCLREDSRVLFVDDSFEIYSSPTPSHDDEALHHPPPSEAPLQPAP
jgi:hypothetical protein